MHLYNELQLKQCTRQIYAVSDEFKFARRFCDDHPALCDPQIQRFNATIPAVDEMISDLVKAAKAIDGDVCDDS
jgi:hypothetical protein